MDTLADKIAIRMKEIAPEHTTSIEIMKFGLITLISNGITIIISLLIGWIAGSFMATLYTIISFILLRAFMGGHHLQSVYICIILSTVVIITIPYIPINQIWCIILTVVSCLIAFIYAPSNLRGYSRVPEKYYLIMKAIAVIIISSNFILLSTILAKSFFIQSISTIKFRRETQ